MNSDSLRRQLEAAARPIEAALRRRRVRLTLGGEPTYIPADPAGPEWNITAVGPEKLDYARRLAAALRERDLPQTLCLFSPGKCYPGEHNPRWMLHLVWRSDGTPIVPPDPARGATPRTAAPTPAAFSRLQRAVARSLGVPPRWLPASDPGSPRSRIAVLLLDHDGDRWRSAPWSPRPARNRLRLLRAEGPAGLRLPLASLDPAVARRALVLEHRAGEPWHAFLPPVSCQAFEQLVRALSAAFRAEGLEEPLYDGYLPFDHHDYWTKLSLGADPGVLEINLPPCPSWQDYHDWLERLADRARETGLYPYRRTPSGQLDCTGGGNHLLFGGPSLEQNPFFRRPGLVASLCRYFQHHPSLAYLFTGRYVGRASQAPRADESTTALEDLEMAYRTLESLETTPGDHRWLICETLRTLHTDDSGSSHRSEISFDKFWLQDGPPGSCAGLIEFRSLASMPEPWMNSAAALLFRALVCRLLQNPFPNPLRDFGRQLHDRFFLPAFVRDDLRAVLSDLGRHGLPLPSAPYLTVWDWQFPVLLRWRHDRGSLTVRRAHESWPLVGDAPTVGGTTSRFVDTSMTRIEFSAPAAFAASHRLTINGRELPLRPHTARESLVGLRFRSSALYPCLHPALPVDHPILLKIETRRGRRLAAWTLDGAQDASFLPAAQDAADRDRKRAAPCRAPWPGAFTCDLRIP